MSLCSGCHLLEDTPEFAAIVEEVAEKFSSIAEKYEWIHRIFILL